MDDVVQPRPGVHHRDRLVVQRLEELRGLGERLVDAGGAADRVAVPGQEELGAERVHGAQRARPFERIALHLLRITGVRGGPDEEVSGAEHPALGDPGPGVIVGLAAAVPQGEAHPANLEVERVAVGRVGVAVVGWPDEARDAELARVDGPVIPRRQAVAVEAGGNPLVRDHARRRPALPPCLLLEGRQAEDVVDVPVREDRGVERPAVPAADRGVELASERGAARVDQDQTRAGLEGRDVREGRHEGNPRIQLLELVERGPGVAVGGREVPAPEPLRDLADLAHAALSSAEGHRDARGLTPGRGPR